MPSQPCLRAKETASTLLEQCECPSYHSFAVNLVEQLSRCFVDHHTFKLQKEAMWGTFHQLRTSDTFTNMWDTFVQRSVGGKGSQVLYQHVTSYMFNELVKKKHEYQEISGNSSSSSLTHKEENILRYIAGYVCKKIIEKLDKSNYESRDAMLLCVMEFSGNMDEESASTEEWTNLLDRGGLRHISDIAYNFFSAMEREVRNFLVPYKASLMDESTKDAIVAAVKTNNAVCEQWCQVTGGGESEGNKVLLNMFINLYITVRGFSFATSCVERYKMENQKLLQKGKGIRKEIFTSSANENNTTNNDTATESVPKS